MQIFRCSRICILVAFLQRAGRRNTKHDNKNNNSNNTRSHRPVTTETPSSTTLIMHRTTPTSSGVFRSNACRNSLKAKKSLLRLAELPAPSARPASGDGLVANHGESADDVTVRRRARDVACARLKAEVCSVPEAVWNRAPHPLLLCWEGGKKAKIQGRALGRMASKMLALMEPCIHVQIFQDC